jgi:hypothetical protein
MQTITGVNQRLTLKHRKYLSRPPTKVPSIFIPSILQAIHIHI